ncbi:MAG: MFS transporter [Trueperaceae bacterium]
MRGPGAGPGWRIAWALAVTQTVGYGILFYAYGVLTVPMEHELGLTRDQTSLAFAAALLASGLGALPAGRIVDRYGGRALMTLGSLAGGALLIAWSQVTGLIGLILVQTGIGLVLAAVTYEIAFTVLTGWFRRDRIRAMLLVTFAAGFASTLFVPATTALVAWIGWRGALLALAAVLWAITVPLHAVVIRRPPDSPAIADNATKDGAEEGGAAPAAGTPRTDEAPERSVPLRRALRSGAFWWLTVGFALDRAVLVAIAAHAVPMLLEAGYGAERVALVVGSIGAFQVAGRLAFAPATARWPLGTLTVATYLLRALALLLLTAPLIAIGAPDGAHAWTDTAALWTFAAAFGLANGASTLARAGLIAERFGPRHYGSVQGAMTTAVALIQTVAPLAVGTVRTVQGDYVGATLLLTAAAIAAAAAVALAGREPADAHGS